MRRTLPVAVVIAATLACGKKGPLLPPYVRQPAAAEISAVRRVGNDVYLTLVVPKADLDGATPASLATIEVWAVTALTPPPAGALPRNATLVATVPVARDAEPGDRSGTVVPDPKTGALQGTTVTIVDTLAADELVPQEPPAVGEKPARPEDAAATPQSIRRYYVTLPRSPRKRIGLLSAIKDVPLAFVPDKVPDVEVAMSGYDIVVRWEPSGGILGWLLDRPLAPEVALAAPASPTSTPPGGTASTPPTTGPTLYNIYRDVAPDPLALSAGGGPLPWTMTPATPVNRQPIAELTFVDKDVPFDERERCYQVRAVRGTGAQQVESESSNRECIIPRDLVPPVAPTGLSATPVEGEVQLRWEPNGEEDLRGYVVLRRESGSDTLLELTRGVPTADTRWVDNQITPGRMYTYEVRAVDTRIPLPNVSDPAVSETITAR